MHVHVHVGAVGEWKCVKDHDIKSWQESERSLTHTLTHTHTHTHTHTFLFTASGDCTNLVQVQKSHIFTEWLWVDHEQVLRRITQFLEGSTREREIKAKGKRERER